MGEEVNIAESTNGAAHVEIPKFDVYLSSSWKNRDRVRALAIRIEAEAGLRVFDFTNPACRNVPEIPPERFPVQFDSSKHKYMHYIQAVPEWRAAVQFNRQVIERCRVAVLMLPCGNDAHADWAYAVGRGLRTAVVGSPKDGDRTPSHMWCDAFCGEDEGVLRWLADEKAADTFQPWMPARLALETPWSEEEAAFASLCVAAIRVAWRPEREREGIKSAVTALGEDRVRDALKSMEWLKPAPAKRIVLA